MRVGFIGLGNMGLGMASNLLAKGANLTVHNRSQNKVDELAAKGAGRAGSIADLTTEELLEFLPDSLSQGNVTIFEGFFNDPVSISVANEVGATLYIADIGDGEVERLVYNAGSYSRSSPVAVNQPSLVSATTVGGLVWVMDSGSKILQYFSDDLSQQGSLNASYIFRTPHVMTAGSGAGDIWIGDNGTHEVVQIVNPDSVGATIAGFNFIEDIIVNR